MKKMNQTISISIMSGKGGVGKTSLALNLSYALHGFGRSCLMMDCDLGLANLDVMLGVTPDRNLQDLIISGADPKSVVYPVEVPGFDFLPAASGVPELVEMDEDLRAQLLSRLDSVFRRYNYLILDLGAGISSTVLAFAAMTRQRIVVVTPEPTSLTDSYALIKVLATQHAIKDFKVVVNQAASSDEAKLTFTRLSAACVKFLKFEPEFLGFVRQDKMLPESVRRQKALLKIAPQSPAASDIKAIAAKIETDRARLLPQIAYEPVLNTAPILQ